MTKNFGSLGTVEIETWDQPDVEVFAKYEGSPFATGGSDYSDDSGGSTTGGYVDPTMAFE